MVTGGGTGGHTYPAITTIRAVRELLQQRGVGLDMLYVGSAGELEARVAEQEHLPFQAVSTRTTAAPMRGSAPSGHLQPPCGCIGEPRHALSAADYRDESHEVIIGEICTPAVVSPSPRTARSYTQDVGLLIGRFHPLS
ncbi:MAG: glycosyltransferase [Pseudonocardiaceae bacterium]